MTDLSEPLFLFGPGYCACALAARWAGPVYGSFRSESGRDKCRGSNIQPVSIADPAGLKTALAGAHLLISAPPDAQGCPALHAVGGMLDKVASVSYLSTTGVYGDLRGGWAMEWSTPKPQSERAQRRLMAEQAWRSTGKPLAIVRLPGIYGPGRSAFDRLRRGKARRIVKPGQVFSRAHVDDIAAGLKAILRTGQTGVFNLCDDEAAPPQDVIAHAAGLLNQAPPPEIAFAEAQLSEMGKSFYAECKRVSNARLKAATGWQPKFPTYREGLAAIYRDGA